MSITGTIPITITPEASAHIAQLGYQREFEEMLEHTLQTVPRIRRIETFLDQDAEGSDIPKIILQPTLDHGPNPALDPFEWEWGRWKVCTYAPCVAEHFLMLTIYGE